MVYSDGDEWEILKESPLWRNDYDHGYTSYGHGILYGYALENYPFTVEIPMGTSLGLYHVRLCVQHCSGEFFRQRGLTGYLTIMRFARVDDAVYFRLML